MDVEEMRMIFESGSDDSPSQNAKLCIPGLHAE